MQLVSGNLNTIGNTGQFETDPSTWAFTGFNGISHARSNDFVFANLWACKSFYSGSSPSSVAQASLGRGLVAIVSGKKYVARVMVRMPSVNAIGLDAYVLSVKPIATVTYVTNVVTTQTRTVAQAKAGWVELECTFDGVGVDPLIFPFGQDGVVQVFMEVSGGGNPQLQPFGAAYIDDFRIFEYVIPANPCTLAIDVPGTVVVNETSAPANNGSITVAITGGTAPFQYSRDGGATWQSSNQFTGLDAGTYNIVVREQNRISCSASQSFVVNTAAGGPTHSFTTQVVHESVAGANDGQITVTASGTGGPFEFSRNGGTTWQTGNVFSGLAPATYSIVVRNSALQGVGQNVTVNAGAIIFERIWLSRNPIVYSRQAPANWQSQVNFRLFDEVRLEINTGTSVLTPVHQVALTPINNKVDFQVREAFRGYLNAIPDVNNSDIKRLTDRIKLFRHATGEVTGTNAVPVTLTESLPHLVMMGGLSKYRYASLDFFGQLSVSKQFMTWAPLRKRVDRAQPDYLNFFVWQVSATQLKISIRAYFDDATDQTSVVKTQTGVQYGQLYQIPTGPLNSGALQINPAKNVSRYEVTVLNQSDVAISQTREYVVEPDSHPRKRFILFLNSLGAYEVLLFTGQADTTVGVSKGTLQKFLPITYNPQDGEFESTYSTLRNSTNYSTGYFTEDNAREWQQYMRELLISRRTFDITAGELKPIIIRGGDYAMGGDQEYELFVRFTADDNYAEESYTP